MLFFTLPRSVVKVLLPNFLYNARYFLQVQNLCIETSLGTVQRFNMVCQYESEHLVSTEARIISEVQRHTSLGNACIIAYFQKPILSHFLGFIAETKTINQSVLTVSFTMLSL